MVENVHDISVQIDKKIVASGRRYHDESTKYLITSEEEFKNSSERKLVADIVYLLTKIRLLEDKMREIIIERENLIYNSKMKRSTIEEQFCGLENIGAK